MATVNIQDNPVAPIVGARDADAVIIASQQSTANLVTYQIEKISTGDVYNIDNAMDSQKGGNIISVTRSTLKIILESRTRYRVRTQSQFGAWSPWVNFKTRDKRYQSPDAITLLSDDSDSSSQTQGTKIVNGIRVSQGGNRTIAVANNAKATAHDNGQTGGELAPRRWGSVTVTNIDTVYNDGQLQSVGNGVRTPVYIHTHLTNTAKGATVINVPSGKNSRIQYTDRGATINTIG